MPSISGNLKSTFHNKLKYNAFNFLVGWIPSIVSKLTGSSIEEISYNYAKFRVLDLEGKKLLDVCGKYIILILMV